MMDTVTQKVLEHLRNAMACLDRESIDENVKMAIRVLESNKSPAPSLEARAMELEVEALRKLVSRHVPCVSGMCPAIKTHYCQGAGSHCATAIREACKAQARAEASSEEVEK